MQQTSLLSKWGIVTISNVIRVEQKNNALSTEIIKMSVSDETAVLLVSVKHQPSLMKLTFGVKHAQTEEWGSTARTRLRPVTHVNHPQ
jgi:hypothetical protein